MQLTFDLCCIYLKKVWTTDVTPEKPEITDISRYTQNSSKDLILKRYCVHSTLINIGSEPFWYGDKFMSSLLAHVPYLNKCYVTSTCVH